MAWLDDRIWCHPKFTNLSPSAFTVYIKALAYSSGMNTRGRLDPAQQKLIGSTKKIRTNLVQIGLWELNGNGQTILIHDWEDHNKIRDERKARDRERKRRERHGHTDDGIPF